MRYQIITCLVVGSALMACSPTSDEPSQSSKEKPLIPRYMYEQHLIEQAGRRLARKGLFDEALVKYREALSDKYVMADRDKISAKGSIVKILTLQEKYDEAIEEFQWTVNRNKRNDEARFALEEIIALKQYKETGDPQNVLDYIERYKEKKAKHLPPSYEWGVGESQVSTMLRLYAKIGDYDAGIALIDEVMTFLRNRRKSRGEENYILYDELKTSQQAEKCAELDKPKKERNPNWRGCRLILEYLLVREAFEKDKADGTKGRATQALIQSDYFPW